MLAVKRGLKFSSSCHILVLLPIARDTKSFLKKNKRQQRPGFDTLRRNTSPTRNKDIMKRCPGIDLRGGDVWKIIGEHQSPHTALNFPFYFPYFITEKQKLWFFCNIGVAKLSGSRQRWVIYQNFVKGRDHCLQLPTQFYQQRQVTPHCGSSTLGVLFSNLSDLLTVS